MKKLSTVFALVTLPLAQAYAAVPTEVQTAMDDGKADALTVAALGLVIIIAIAAFKYMRRGV